MYECVALLGLVCQEGSFKVHLQANQMVVIPAGYIVVVSSQAGAQFMRWGLWFDEPAQQKLVGALLHDFLDAFPSMRSESYVQWEQHIAAILQ